MGGMEGKPPNPKAARIFAVPIYDPPPLEYPLRITAEPPGAHIRRLQIELGPVTGNADCPTCGRVNQERDVAVVYPEGARLYCSGCMEDPEWPIKEEEREAYRLATA